jgi:Holliday junction resolvase RusA-like endonuclease
VADAITFTVKGMKPASQGSKVLMRGRMVESCKDLPRWRSLIARTAEALGVGVIPGPVSLSVVFVFARPANHFKKSGAIKPNAPRWHMVRPDIDKISRALADALTKVLFEDDARVVSLIAQKRYCVGDEQPGAIVTIVPLGTKSSPVESKADGVE